MKVQIISKNPITITPNGESVHVLRTNNSVRIYEDEHRSYVVTNEYAKYIDKPILDQEGNPTNLTEKQLVTLTADFGTLNIPTVKRMYPNEIIQLGALLNPLVPKELNEVESDIFKRKHALLHLTVNDKDAPNGYMGTKEWEVLSQKKYSNERILRKKL